MGGILVPAFSQTEVINNEQRSLYLADFLIIPPPSFSTITVVGVGFFGDLFDEFPKH